MVKRSNRIQQTTGEKIFHVCNVLFMLLLIIITVYPFWYTVMCSFSDARMLQKHIGGLALPLTPWTLQGYTLTFENASILTGLKNTAFYVVAGTGIGLILTCFGAFAVSRTYFKLAPIMMKMFLVTMFFSGGIIPLFFVVRLTGIYDTPYAMFMPYLVHTYYLIILRTAFKGIPDSLEESARLDGANDLQILFHIFIPLSLPSLAVITLYYAVGYWNSWYPAMIFLRDRSLYPLQMVLHDVLIQNDTLSADSAELMAEEAYYRELVKYCTVVVSTVPILILYPFLQKFFVKGVMIGAVKG